MVQDQATNETVGDQENDDVCRVGECSHNHRDEKVLSVDVPSSVCNDGRVLRQFFKIMGGLDFAGSNNPIDSQLSISNLV